MIDITPYLPHLACLFIGALAGFLVCAWMTMAGEGE